MVSFLGSPHITEGLSNTMLTQCHLWFTIDRADSRREGENTRDKRTFPDPTNLCLSWL